MFESYSKGYAVHTNNKKIKINIKNRNASDTHSNAGTTHTRYTQLICSVYTYYIQCVSIISMYTRDPQPTGILIHNIAVYFTRAAAAAATSCSSFFFSFSFFLCLIRTMISSVAWIPKRSLTFLFLPFPLLPLLLVYIFFFFYYFPLLRVYRVFARFTLAELLRIMYYYSHYCQIDFSTCAHLSMIILYAFLLIKYYTQFTYGKYL